MKAVEWQRIAMPHLQPKASWAFEGPIAYRLPFKYVLRGFLAEGSSLDKGAYVWRITVPLFIPSAFVVLDYSERISRGKFYSSDVAPLRGQLAIEGERTADEDTALEYLASLEMRSLDRKRAEVKAYACLMVGRIDQARILFQQIRSGIVSASWEGELLLRCALIERLCVDSGAQAATEQLAAWSSETAAALKLTAN